MRVEFFVGGRFLPPTVGLRAFSLSGSPSGGKMDRRLLEVHAGKKKEKKSDLFHSLYLYYVFVHCICSIERNCSISCDKN